MQEGYPTFLERYDGEYDLEGCSYGQNIFHAKNILEEDQRQ